MARARLLKPGFFTNELLAELPYEGRLLFAGLWTLADREGRLEDRPKRIKAAVFPFDEVDVSALLAALEHKGFIERYHVDAMALIQIAKFAEHQTPHARETASTLPPSKGSAQASPRSPVYGNGSDPVCGNGSDSAEPLTRSTPAFLTFPVVGAVRTWDLPEGHVLELQTHYPNLDVRAECRKALSWAQANAGRRKTAKGMPAFLANWMSRATDRRGGERRETPRGAGDRRSPMADDWICSHSPKCLGRNPCRILDVIAAEKARAS